MYSEFTRKVRENAQQLWELIVMNAKVTLNLAQNEIL